MPASTSNSIWNIPNILTLLRIAAIPVLVVLLLSPSRSAGFWAAALFSAAGRYDGYRKLVPAGQDGVLGIG